MLLRIFLAVNPVLALAGCLAPEPARGRPDADSPYQPEVPKRFEGGLRETTTVRGLRQPGPERLFSGRLSEMEPPPPAASLVADHTVLDELGTAVTGAGFNEELGAGIVDALAAARADGRNTATYGVAALDYGTLYGDTFHSPVCEAPQLTWSDRSTGDKWSITVGTKIYSVLVGEPEALYISLPNNCVAELLANGGDVQAAIDVGRCIDYDVEAFMPAGTDCRACVEEGGDFDGCVDAGECLAEAPATVAVGYGAESRFYQQAFAYYLACAPDYTSSAILLGRITPDGTFARPFDREAWAGWCLPYWSEAYNAPDYTCTTGPPEDLHGDSLQIGVTGVVEGMRQPDDDTPYWRHSLYYTPRITTDSGWDLRYQWLWYEDLAALSAPVREPDTNGDGVVDVNDSYHNLPVGGGWGLNPLDLRPDGMDPDEVNDTFARDWLGAMALKTATTHSGIPITMTNHNRCADDAWEGPAEDGSYRCREMTAVPESGWLDDGVSAWYWEDQHQLITFPVATLASTGLPDPDIPGGIVPYVASSPTLANPDWDDCAWEHTFVPDRVPLNDIPGDWAGPSSLEGDSWRFGAHPDQDFRVVLSTNVARDYCPDGAIP